MPYLFSWWVKWQQTIQSFPSGSFSFVSDLTGSWRSSRLRQRSLWQVVRNSQSSLPAFFTNYWGLGEPKGLGMANFLIKVWATEPQTPQKITRQLKNEPFCIHSSRPCPSPMPGSKICMPTAASLVSIRGEFVSRLKQCLPIPFAPVDVCYFSCNLRSSNRYHQGYSSFL